jgi:putative hemolysin
MDLIGKEEFIKASKLGKFKLEGMAGLLMEMMQLNKLNELNGRHTDKKGIDFIEHIFKDLDVRFEVDDSELKNIPQNGAFICVANHPFGGLDGMILMHIFSSQRPDFKVMANFLLQKIDSLKDLVIPVNPFDSKIGGIGSVSGMRKAIEHIKEGKPIGIFPAGEVSSFQTTAKSITDKEWNQSVIKLIYNAEVPVVPVYFKGANGLMFHLLGLIHPLLRTVKLPSELLNKKHKSIKVRIGKPISPTEVHSFKDYKQFGRFLRAKTYALGSPLAVKKFFKPSLSSLIKPEKIIDPIPAEVLQEEIDKIRESALIHTQNEFELYIAHCNSIPSIINEIGRLREHTFRDIEEGTNHSVDLDEFDLYYHHLFIWDKNAQCIVGAYRLGKGQDIMAKYGVEGFYIYSLFKIKKGLYPIMEQSVELGRSFIRKEYQKKILPLFLLWKGILYFVLKNKEYRYLIGPVSISNRYSKLSKSFIINFVKENFYNAHLAEFIQPRHTFKPKVKGLDSTILFEGSGNSIQQLDKFIEEIEPQHFNVPVLLKKYMKQNAKIIGFNVDPKFGKALDGLMLLDMNELPEETIKDLKKDFQI